MAGMPGRPERGRGRGPAFGAGELLRASLSSRQAEVGNPATCSCIRSTTVAEKFQAKKPGLPHPFGARCSHQPASTGICSRQGLRCANIVLCVGICLKCMNWSKPHSVLHFTPKTIRCLQRTCPRIQYRSRHRRKAWTVGLQVDNVVQRGSHA